MSSDSSASFAKFVIQGPVQASSPLVSDFEERHPRWLSAQCSDSPAYRLPTGTIDGLQRPRPHRPPVLHGDDAVAERDFTSLCDQLSAVGIWNRLPVCYPYLTPRTSLPAADMRQAGFSRAEVLQAQQAELAAGDAVRRLKGYAGWLICDPQFLRDRDALKTSWQALESAQRPGFPLQRSIQLPGRPQGTHRVEEGLASFQQALNVFLDRWGLTQLAAWELPEPQGPLLPVLLPPNSPAMPRHGLHIVLPIHYPLTASDDLLRQIRQQQIELARENDLDASLAGLPHFDVFAQMLEVEHLERAIRSRYGRGGQRGGFVTAMEHAIAAALNLRTDHIKRLRKGISACKRGRRSTVRWLRSPADGSA